MSARPSHADGDGPASKCLLRRQTESQRDSLHPGGNGRAATIPPANPEPAKVLSGAKRESIREPWAKPRLKVPAPQAEGVAARLPPPGWPARPLPPGAH